MKTCGKCKIEKALELFPKVKRESSKYRSKCKQCFALDFKNYKSRHPDKVKLTNRNRYLKNKDEFIANVAEWHKKNPEKVKEKSQRRRNRIKLCTPKWANLNEIKEFYKNCPSGHEVDHIIPISNKNICGLHVIYNLQYLKTESNKSKSNNF